jgi:predicted enzyme related to lactoylglutathione lyase
MHTKSILRLAPVFAAAAIAAGFTTSARADKFPPLNTPDSTAQIPGKLVWADLFTSDIDASTTFYSGLFGWSAASLDQKGKTYTVFTNDGRPVAGLVQRTLKGVEHPSRWIGYYSVADIDASLALVTKNGGVVRAPSRMFPDRGHEAIVTDIDSIPVGFIQSSSGDPADGEPRPGDWNWFELYVKNPTETSAFYHDVLGYMVAPETKSDRKSDFVLTSADQARGGIAPLPDGTDSKPSWLGVVRVSNLDDTLAKVPGLGGEVLVPPHSVEFGSRFAIILDNTGGTIGLVQYMDNANPAKNP